MMQTQSNIYEPTSFMDGTPMPRTVLMMVASEGISGGKGEGNQVYESVRGRETGPRRLKRGGRMQWPCAARRDAIRPECDVGEYVCYDWC
jgi:hypothetical protein